jgi:molybdate transport system substrate-binding protein
VTQDKQKMNAGKTSQRKRNVTLILLAIIIVAAAAGSATYMSRLGTTSAPKTRSPTITSMPISTTPSPTQTPIEQPAHKTPTEMRCFVAASLTNIVKKHADERFERENNVRILFNFGGSDALYQQIYSGSPCDVYIAADFKWTNMLQKDGLLDNDHYWNFTTNKLIIILPADNPRNITSLLDLTRPNTKIVVAGWTVPVGKYTESTLTKIQKTWGNRSDPNYKGPQWEHYRDRVVNNIVSYEPAVTYVVTKILMGICDAGFAYVTDVKFQGPKLQYVEIPSSVNTIGTYGIAVTKGASNRDLATKYVNFWLSEEGQKLLADFGFGVSNQTK